MQLTTMILFGYSQWSAYSFSEENALHWLRSSNLRTYTKI
jgi:hypothetical protein